MSDLHDAAAAELRAVMDAIFDEFHAPELGPSEFTPGLYAEHHGISLPQANCEIEQAVKAGRLVFVGERTYGGRKRPAYRRRVGE